MALCERLVDVEESFLAVAIVAIWLNGRAVDGSK